MANKTAVEWLIEYIDMQYPDLNILREKTVIDKAKKIEKEQIIDAFWNGDNTDCTSEQNSKQFAEQYYNETYKSE